MRAFVWCNGDLPSEEIIFNLGEISPLFAVDGGADKARTLGFDVIEIFGDLDSVDIEKYFSIEEFFQKEMPAYVEKSIEEAIEVYKSLGAEMVEISLSNVNLSLPIYYIIAPAECSANLSRYDGVRYGYRCEDPKDIEDLFMRTREEGFGAEVKRRILIGTYALSAGYYDAYYLKAQKCRQLVANDFSEAFKSVDVILSPTYPILNEYNSNGKFLYHFDLYRLKSMGEFLEIGGLEYLNNHKAITLIEWPELIENIDMINKIEIEFEHISEKKRLIKVL